MNKNDIQLRVQDSTEDDGSSLEVTAWEKPAVTYQVDDHVTELFPSLIPVGLEDLCEGTMEYGGDLDKHQLAATLVGMGFDAIAI